MAATFVALLTLDGFDEMKRRLGYAEAVRVIDRVRDAMAGALPQARGLRANRSSIEFAFEASSRGHAEQVLLGVGAALARAIDSAPAAIMAAVESRGNVITEPLLRQAEAALAEASRRAIPLLIVAEDLAPDDQRLMADLRRAIDADALELHYQPKLRTRTGDLAGAEALVRWTHPDLGAIGPDRFIPIAEGSGDIAALTCWTIDRALADHHRLAGLGLDVPLHVNMSAPLLAEAGFTAAVLARIAGHEASIGFEITETAIMADPEGTLARVEDMARAGVRLAIDDYGAGFSSLHYLRRLPVRELKIDRMFVASLATSARDPLLVRSTIDLAHALEMEVTAEGVETAATLALLQVMGCDIVQGFFLSRALPFDAFVDYARGAASTRLPRPISLRDRLAQRRSSGEPGA